MSQQQQLPSTLVGKPTLALVEPGKCQFTPEFVAVKLLENIKVSETSHVLRFGLPDESKPLNLSTCACILAKADLVHRDEGTKAPVIRPYTPISTNAQIGSFDLLVKNYESNGFMSTHLCNLEKGATVEFKHIDFNVKIQAPFTTFTKIGMIVGGTGITPMIQALHAILGSTTEESTTVGMLYGSRVSSDILGKEMLDVWCNDYKTKFDVMHVLSHEPKESDWKGERGFITKELIEKQLPSPKDENGIIFVCGPPVMYDIFCGPRGDKELKGILAEMGYKAEQVYKF